MKQHLLSALLVCAAALPMWAQSPTVAPEAPAAVSDMTVVFTPGGLNGTVTFTAPNRTFAGEPMSGNLKYSIMTDGVQIATGSVYSGVNRDVDITVAEKGEYEISLVTSNTFGTSPAATVKIGAGYMAPEAPSPKAVSDITSVTVSWNAVTATTDGVSLEGVPVTYRVVRYPDGKVVADGITDTSVTDTDMGTGVNAYTYGVCAVARSVPSEEALTEPAVAGVASTPWSASFASQEEMDFFRIFDRDADGRTWTFYYGEVTTNVGNDDPADDWIISPAVGLAPGKYHTVSVDLKVRDADFPGKLEVLCGSAPDPSAMTMTAIPAVTFTNTAYKTYKGVVKAEGDAPLYFALHSITEPGNWWIYATDFSVSEPLEGTVPAAPTDLSLIADIDGAMKVEVSLKAPLTNLDGGPLASIEKVEVYRDGQLIHTADTPAPGALITFTDTDMAEGEHNYSAVAVNSSGAGIEAVGKVYAGINLPATPAAATAVETTRNGYVTVSWEPVTTYIDGTPLNPANVTYNIWTNVTGSDMKILAGLTGTSHTFQIIDEGETQLFFQFGVTAETQAGENFTGVMTEYVPAGEPFASPYEESFPDLSVTYAYVQGGSDAQSFWDNGSDTTFEEVTSQDGDNGMLYMFGAYKGSSGYLNSAKIDLAGLSKPVLTFYVFNYSDPSMPNENTVEVSIATQGEEVRSAGVWKVCDLGAEGWHRIQVPLDAYEGRSIQVRILGTAVTYQYIHIDNMQIRDRYGNDLAVTGFTAPERVKAGNSAPLTVDYANYGLNPAGAFAVEVLRDGEKVAERTFDSMPSDGRGSLEIPMFHSVTLPETVEYQVNIAYAADEVKDNNLSPVLPVVTMYPTYPVVTDLKAFYGSDSRAVKLEWTAPDLTGALEDDITEGMEDAMAWSSNLKGWKFLDRDGYLIYGFNFFDVPARGPQPMSRQSWWVLDCTYEPMVNHFSDPNFYTAHTGKHVLCSMAVTDDELVDKMSDDWAISPELCGAAQTVSLWAKSMLSDALETFEVLYSTSGTEAGDFSSLKTVKNVPWDWTQYYFNLPEGTRHLAIRSRSRDAYVLMIDDINYIPAGTNADLEVEGYNVYRDGVRINDGTVAAPGYEDVLPDNGSHRYTVTTLYRSRGESGFSNEAVPELSSLGTVAASAVSVAVEGGEIVIIGADGLGIEIYSVDGRIVSSAIGSGVDRIAAIPGVYLVRIAGTVTKVVVK